MQDRIVALDRAAKKAARERDDAMRQNEALTQSVGEATAKFDESQQQLKHLAATVAATVAEKDAQLAFKDGQIEETRPRESVGLAFLAISELRV